MSTSGRNDNYGSDNEEEETSDAKIERLATEIEELKASLIGVPEMSDEWFRIKTDIKDRNVEWLLLNEKKRCDNVVKEYFEENPHVLEAAPECPICLEKMWEGFGTVRNVCCGKQICRKCSSQGGSVFNTCPLCRGVPPRSDDEMISIYKEKAGSGVAWAQSDIGRYCLWGLHGVQQDVEKAEALLSEAAEKGYVPAMEGLGDYYFQIANNYEEARRWFEAAAAEGGILSLFHLGTMMTRGHAFDQNEETRAEAFRLITISATLSEGHFHPATVQLFQFSLDCKPVMLHYLRPAVEGGSADVELMCQYALGLFYVAIQYYGQRIIFAPGYSPVPEVLFWHRQYSRKEEPDAENPLVRLEREIRQHCAHCRADLPTGKRPCCVECKAAYYCNRDCQVAHWKAGHKKDCVRKLKKRLRAEGKLDKKK